MEDEVMLRSGTKSNKKGTRVVPHKCLTTYQQMIAVRVILVENCQLQGPSTVNSRNLNRQTQKKYIDPSPYWPVHLIMMDNRVKGATEGVKIGMTDFHYIGLDGS